MKKSLLLPVLLSACTNHSLSPPDTLVVELEGPTQTINPLYTMDTNSQHINELGHASLVVMGERLVPEPYLAEEFSYEGNLAIRFRLRKGCRLESGKEITSDVVERSIAFYNDPKNESPFSKTAFERIKKFEKIDDYSFRISTDKPSPSLLTDMELLKILDLENEEAGKKPQFLRGAGPYRLVSFQPSEVVLERSGQPCLPQPRMQKIKVKVVRDDLSRFLKLKRGELDLVLNDMNYRKIDMVLKDPTLPMEARMTDSASYVYMGVNQNSANLRDPRVRMALAKSLDVQQLIRYKSRGLAKQARGMLADMNFYSHPGIQPVTRDLEGARRLLDEAGYFNGSNGKPPLQLSLKTSSGTASVENARVLAAQAREAGIVINHRAYDWGVYFADVKAGNTELYTLSWTGITEPNLYYDLFHSSQIGKNNRTRYRNPEMDKLMEEGGASLDPVKRRPVYLKIQELFAQDLPFISLWHPKNTAVFRKNVKGVKVHPLGTWRVILNVWKEEA